jgi:hypothetical protein
MRNLSVLFLLIGFSCGSISLKADTPDWSPDFTSPPESARTHTWWHWMDGNVSRIGITADLEAMHRVGIQSATIVVAELGVPHSSLMFLSSDWLDLLKFAAQEADRLGMKLGMGNCAGWSSSGGPWVTPEYSMQMVVESEKQLTGPSHFSEILPQPETRESFYRDLQVIAIPTPSEEKMTMDSASPTITGSDNSFDGSHLNHEPTTLPVPTAAQPQYVQFAFAQPFPVRTVRIDGPGDSGGRAELQASDDGQGFHSVQQFDLLPTESMGGYDVKPISARFFRVVFLHLKTEDKTFPIVGITLSPAPVIPNYRRKALYGWRQNSAEFANQPPVDVPADMVVQPAQVTDLSGHLDATGKLDWQVPPGKWTVLRFGYTTTGATNHPAWGDGRGLECDKLSRPAARVFWNGIMPKIQQTLGPLMGKTFDHVLIDSYEIGLQNWTPDLRQEFQKRCHYDMFPFLPVLTGRYVDSPEKSERFLWDFRRTIADLFAENYYDYFDVMCHQAGIKLEVEPYGDGPFEDLRCARDTDRVMGEFWYPDGGAIETLKLAASVAHVYGKSVVGAESFTSEDGGDDMCPANLKALGDRAFASGVNAYDFHRYVHQPWPYRPPGISLGPYGSNLERTNNWWEESGGWQKYLARCNLLLQKGLFVADLLYADDEGAPADCPQPQTGGYAYDCVDQDALLHLLSVKDGKLTLPDGMTYRALVLPSAPRMTPALLQKLKEFADAGATIIGPKPSASPSLVGYPQCDDEVKQLSDKLWGSGKIISGKSEVDVLRSLGVKPDFECAMPIPPLAIHRVVGDTDIYFVSNQRNLDEDADCIFRVTGKTPELWHADSGEIEKIADYSDDGERMHVPLNLDPAGSVFVIFRPGAKTIDHPLSVARTDTGSSAAASDLVIRQAIYGDIQGIGTMDVSARLTSMIRDGSLNLVVGNDVFGKDPSPDLGKVLKLDYVLNGKEVKATLHEGAAIDLVTPRAGVPDCALEVGNNGGITMQAWKPGTYEIKMSGGETVTKNITTLPAPLTVTGPWEVTFPPNWGAPAQASFDSLISWSDANDSGVKYFSGTATYDKMIQIPADMLGQGRRVYLDLGNVQVIAQVRLNGRDLGTLWKPPYRVEITPEVRTGAHSLEIKVTNMWPNRMIGDEQLPVDCDWKPDGSLQRFPQWLLDGKPSPTGRFTFSTHTHWKKDSPLLPSGLIGPVTLVPTVDLSVP